MQKFFDSIEKYSLLPSGGSVLVGLSGGADSVCLTHFLKSNEEVLGITVSAVHINHMLRGSEADRDEEFCREFCSAYGIPFKSVRIDVGEIARQKKLGTEECARNIRYKVFEGENTDYIATAHTLSDSFETVIMNILRGTGLNGVCGIPPKRGKIIRPLIESTREDILKYNEEHSLTFVTDSSNNSDDYTRNKVRHSVVPQLLSINRALYKNLTKFLDSVNSDRVFLEGESNNLLKKCKTETGYDISLLGSCHDAIVNRVIISAVEDLTGTVPEYKHISAIKNLFESGGKVQINGGHCLEVKNGILYVPKCAYTDEWSICADIGEHKLPFGTVTVRCFSNSDSFHRVQGATYFDADKVKEPFTMRSRKAGDKYKLGNRGVTKSVKKLLNEMCINNSVKMQVPVFEYRGEVVALMGNCPVRSMMLTKKTQHILEVRIKYYDER